MDLKVDVCVKAGEEDMAWMILRSSVMAALPLTTLFVVVKAPLFWIGK
jgi:hypothetical protein